jgi:hypothetical protein
MEKHIAGVVAVIFLLKYLYNCMIHEYNDDLELRFFATVASMGP